MCFQGKNKHSNKYGKKEKHGALKFRRNLYEVGEKISLFFVIFVFLLNFPASVLFFPTSLEIIDLFFCPWTMILPFNPLWTHPPLYKIDYLSSIMY